MSPSTWKSAAKRAIRTFVQAFVAVYPLPALISVASGSTLLDLSLLRAAGVAGMAALIALVWRLFIDPLPVPTLADPPAVGQPPDYEAKK